MWILLTGCWRKSWGWWSGQHVGPGAFCIGLGCTGLHCRGGCPLQDSGVVVARRQCADAGLADVSALVDAALAVATTLAIIAAGQRGALFLWYTLRLTCTLNRIYFRYIISVADLNVVLSACNTTCIQSVCACARERALRTFHFLHSERENQGALASVLVRAPPCSTGLTLLVRHLKSSTSYQLSSAILRHA